MKFMFPNRKIAVVVGFVFSAILFAQSGARATSDNRQHELGVYSLYEYGTYSGDQWKAPVYPGPEADPYELFWDLMTSGTARQYAYHTSRRRLNSQVNYHTIFPIAGDGWKDWDQFDFVFFYGHNNMITPPHRCNNYHYWSNNPDGWWHEIEGNQCDWGTPALPFEYYERDLRGGDVLPGSVTYLYEPFTSALAGYHFHPVVPSWYVQTVAQDRAWGNSPETLIACTGGLGTNDLEWIVFHGCQAVIVANADGSSYHPLGVGAFSKTWDGFHIILGHYRSFGVPSLSDLSPFAFDLLGGVPMQAAYFRTGPMNRVSAISAEYFAPLDSPHYDPLLLDYWLRTLSCMANDSWTNPRDDLSSPNLWYTRWIRETGTLASHWIRAEPASFLLLLSRWFHFPEAHASQNLPGINLATYTFRDKTLQKDLGIPAIPIRRAYYQLPPMTLPLLKLEPVLTEQIPLRLKSLVSQFAKVTLSDQDIRDFGDILSAKVGSKVFWVSKASGAISFTNTDQIMGAPATLRDHCQAVEVALKHVATEGLVELGAHESLDVVFVSQVMNAAVKNGEKQPLRQYPSDYFVGLGRRYRGVPVVDSQLIVRLGPDGRLLGVKKKWRPLAGEEGSVTITSSSFNNQLNSFFQAKKILTPGQTVEQDVRILGSAWGYLEGPFCNEQHRMAPGALVNYRLQDKYCDGDLVAQAAIPLASIDFPLLGGSKRFPPPQAPEDPVSDTDDQTPDEPN